ncbi:dTMP kinase [Candidatus Woesearchaeota archaeon]|nr:dTMP kinase [Candidatus Woesearchaeota archaeon]
MINYKGKFITFEGNDGCGKSTQLKLLAEYLQARGLDVLLTKEPGGTLPSCTIIRDLLQNPDYKDQMTTMAELFLFEANRSIHTMRLILPSLEQGKIVLCDRYYDSSTAYQGIAGNLGLDLVMMLNRLASHGLIPDLTFYIDAIPEETLDKIGITEFGRLDRLESKPKEEHQRRVDCFRALSLLEPNRIRLIRYIPNKPEEMQRQIRAYIDKLLSNN